MSDMNIQLPFEIQGEILKRAPEVKSLLRFRSVSKSWKSLIDSPRFIADYNPQPPRRHILVRYIDVSTIDNDDDDSCFGQHKVPLSIPIPEPIHKFEIYGSSGGLFCLYRNYGKPVAYLWNPSIRKLSVAIDVFDTPIKTVIGFGVSPYSSDPKVVKIQTFVNDLKPRRVEVYSLSTGEWRTLSSEVLLRPSVVFKHGNFIYGDDNHVAIGNFIFWLAEDVRYENTDGGPCCRTMIILFDMISEKFTEIYLPDHMTKDDQYPYNRLSLFKIRESLAVVVSSFNHNRVNRRVNHVWMMEGGVSDSFTKMYSVIRPNVVDFSLLAFRNNGHPIIRVDYGGEYELFVYEPHTEQFTPIAATRHKVTRYAGSYTETLLLLDH